MADATKLDRRLMEQWMFGAGRARKGDDDFTIWLTNPTNEFELPDIGRPSSTPKKPPGASTASISASRRSCHRDRALVRRPCARGHEFG